MNIAPASSSPGTESNQQQQKTSLATQPLVSSSGPGRKRKSESSNQDSKKKRNLTSMVKPESDKSQLPHSSGHRPVTSCTHCRQHKIKCNASENYPRPCQRCERMGLSCEIDPQFRPKKGSQIQTLRNDVDELKAKLELLHKNESFIANALLARKGYISQGGGQSGNSNPNSPSPPVLSPLDGEKIERLFQQTSQMQMSPPNTAIGMTRSVSETTNHRNSNPNNYPPIIAKTFLKRDPQLLYSKSSSSSPDSSSNLGTNNKSPELLNDSAPANADDTKTLPPYLQESFRGNSSSPVNSKNSPDNNNGGKALFTESNNNQPPLTTNIKTPNIKEFILGDVHLPLSKAIELHFRFVNDYLPFLPILTSNSAIELYSQSQLLFWTVCLTACLSDPEPTLYNKLASLIKQLAIETCWIRTPRSTHIVQSLLILSCWPLPNQKVLDDCSYRFVGLAKNLGFQLGLHRGKFISEFSRTQVSLVNAEKWRTRTWLLVFFCEQLWASILGLPPCIQTDYLVESARLDQSLPKNFRCLVCLSIFQSKLVNIMGSSVTSPDGLMTAENRAGSLNILIRELERLVFKLKIDDPITEMYYLYVKLLVCAFAFLPETPPEDQTKYVTISYHAATRIVTIFSKLVEVKQLSEYPVYVRHSVTYACFTLFKLHLTPLLLEKYVDSARQSIVTVHRLFRNMLAAWKDVDNDISRTAKVLEKLNYVIITQPSIYLEGEGIIKSNRSHLANSLFYDLVSCIHEARRRNIAVEQARANGQPIPRFNKPTNELSDQRKLVPLPFYNQITRDNFKTISSTSPNGTTITTLVPTKSAMSNAKADALANGLSGPTKINGIPLPLLEATGSISAGPSKTNSSTNIANLKDVGDKKSQSKPRSNYNLANPVNLPNTVSSVNNNNKFNNNNTGNSQTMNNTNFSNMGSAGNINSLFDYRTSMPQPSQQNSMQFPSESEQMKQFYQPSNSNTASPNNFAQPMIRNNSGSIKSTSSNNNNENFFGEFMQQQSSENNNNDDFLGWFDVNMSPEF